MIKDIANVHGAIYSRAVEDGDGNMIELPGWAWIVFICDFLVFFPVFLYCGYTLAKIFPVLSIIEDPAPPAYEPVDLNDDGEFLGDDTNAPLSGTRYKVDQSPALTTSSLRRINKLLLTTGGWTANFRGIACNFVLSLATGFAGILFMSIPVVRYFGVLLAHLATIQLSTAWTHIVISAPSERPWHQRLPPLRKTFEATAVPVSMYWAATTLVSSVTRAMAGWMGLDQWDPLTPTYVPQYGGDSVWKSILVLLTGLLGTIFLIIPAHVVLVRVQASLLPPDEDAIVPFDRSFSGKLEPVIVGGKGYVTVKDAWTTFSRESWIRLVKLLGKIMGVTFAAYAVMMAIVVPEFMLMMRSSTPVNSN